MPTSKRSQADLAWITLQHLLPFACVWCAAAWSQGEIQSLMSWIESGMNLTVGEALLNLLVQRHAEWRSMSMAC